MSRIIKKGATSQSVYFEILDSTSTTGGRKTGLAYNTASLTAYYARNGGSATAITLATLAAANSAYSSGGFKEVDATNMPGVYRLDLPNAAVASGADSVAVTLRGATGMVQASIDIQLTAVDLQDAVRGGMTALPNANAEAAGGLYTRGTGAGQIAQNANGQIDARTVGMEVDVITSNVIADGAFIASKFEDDCITAGAFAADAVAEIQNGLATAANLAIVAGYLDTEIAAIKAKTDNLPAAPAAVGDIPSAASIATAVIAAGDIDGYSLGDSQKIILAAAAGKVSGGGSGTIVVRAADDSKARITATGDSNGNRFTITIDATG